MDRRRADEVLDDHLLKAKMDLLDEDLALNYAEDVVFLTGWGVFEGHDGARALYERLTSLLLNPRFEYVTVATRGEMGFLEWTAESDTGRVRDGVDSYLIRDGKVRLQTIHYTVESSSSAAGAD